MKLPSISIIVPVYNSEKTLKYCLDALRNLDYKNYEVVVVNDCSKDGSQEIAEKYPFKIINLKCNSGAAEARNEGARNAKGEMLLFTDADVVLPADTLKKAADYYLRGNRVFIGRFNPKIRLRGFFSNYKHLYLCYYYLKQDKQLHTLDTSLTCISRKVFEKHKGFKKGLRISEDAELGTRLTRSGEIITQPYELTMEHIKPYTFSSFLKTDFVRGERFSKLLLKSVLNDKKEKNKENGKKSFFLRPITLYLSVGITPFLILSLLSLAWFMNVASLILFLDFSLLFAVLNIDFWSYLGKQRGKMFVLKSFFITPLDMIAFDAGITITFLKTLILGRKALK